MSLLIKAGVSNFLGLADTPAAYAGEKGKAASVNTAENALEFTPMAAAEQFPIFTSDVLYNGVKNDTWEDLDCGVGPAIVYIKIEHNDPLESPFYQFIPGDDPLVPAPLLGLCISYCPVGTGARLGYVMIHTDSAGKVRWCESMDTGVTTTLTLIAYWPDVPMPKTKIFDGVSVVAWTDMAIGPANALAIIRITNTDAADVINFRARMKGETQDSTAGSCGCAVILGLFSGVGRYAFLLVATDAEGKIEWRDDNAGRDFTVHLEAYIQGVSFPRLELFDGLAPLAWQDLDTPFGQGFLYLRLFHETAAGMLGPRYRGNDETQDTDASGGALIAGDIVLNSIGYSFIPLDVYGTAEWMANNARGVMIRAEALTQ